jgi:hypothetical protein
VEDGEFAALSLGSRWELAVFQLIDHRALVGTKWTRAAAMLAR